jgi:N-carbamoylputrescine amidase
MVPRSGSFDCSWQLKSVLPNSNGWHPQKRVENQHGAWMSVMKGHAVANGDVAAANRIGLEQYLPDMAEFSFGIFLYCGTTRNFSALTRQRRNLIAEVDLDLQENVRQNWPSLEIEE